MIPANSPFTSFTPSLNDSDATDSPSPVVNDPVFMGSFQRVGPVKNPCNLCQQRGVECIPHQRPGRACLVCRGRHQKCSHKEGLEDEMAQGASKSKTQDGSAYIIHVAGILLTEV
jgi:hypothetical protein